MNNGHTISLLSHCANENWKVQSRGWEIIEEIMSFFDPQAGRQNKSKVPRQLVNQTSRNLVVQGVKIRKLLKQLVDISNSFETVIRIPKSPIFVQLSPFFSKVTWIQ